MWKAVGEWCAALLVTAAMAVSMLGAAEWIEQRQTVAVPATASAFTVAVDAGHGGFDGGAVGTVSGVKEDGLNLAVAELLKSKLEAAGLRVVMTRETSEALGDNKAADMAERKRILSGTEVDLAVSVHMNKFRDPDIAGAMAYYMQGSEQGQILAQTVIDSVSDAVGKRRRLANPGDYFVLRECACPAVLVECGFLSNAVDEQALQDPAHQEKLARGIADGVLKYLGNRGYFSTLPLLRIGSSTDGTAVL